MDISDSYNMSAALGEICFCPNMECDATEFSQPPNQSPVCSRCQKLAVRGQSDEIALQKHRHQEARRKTQEERRICIQLGANPDAPGMDDPF